MKTIAIINSRVQLKEKNIETILFLVALVCTALFAVSALQKIVDHERFLKGLMRVKLIGQYAGPISYFVPASEIMVGLILIIPPMQRMGFWAFTGLMTVFTLYISSMIFWAEKLPCNCNLIIENLSWGQHLGFNLGFIALSSGALWLGRAKETSNK